MEENYLHSSYREKLVEHLFVGELLKLSWLNKDFSLEVSTPEVDNSGYDLIIEANGIIRHVQLKSVSVGASTSSQKVHISLASKPSGCVVWIYFDPNTASLGPFKMFGSKPGKPLPDLGDFKVARHTKANAEGFKAERPNIRTVPKGNFETFEMIEALFGALFGLA